MYPQDKFKIAQGNSNNSVFKPFFKSRSFDILIQEILGFIASSEGIAYIIADFLNKSPKPHNVMMIPGAAGTFYALGLITFKEIRTHFQKRTILYIGNDYILIPKLDFEKVNVFPQQMGCLELLEFNNLNMVQKRSENFEISIDTQINCVSLFIWIGFPFANEENHLQKTSRTTHLVCTNFPYGAIQSVSLTEKTKWKNMLSCSSNANEGLAAASNWQNKVLILPDTLHLSKDEVLHVDTEVNLTNYIVSYHIQIMKGSISNLKLVHKFHFTSDNPSYFRMD